MAAPLLSSNLPLPQPGEASRDAFSLLAIHSGRLAQGKLTGYARSGERAFGKMPFGAFAAYKLIHALGFNV